MMEVDDQAMPKMSSRGRSEHISRYFGDIAADDDDDIDHGHARDHDDDHDHDDEDGLIAPAIALPSDTAATASLPKKKGRKPKVRPEGEPEKLVKPRKPRGPNKVPRESKPPKEPKLPKEKKVKEPKERKVRKNAKSTKDGSVDTGSTATSKNDRSILNYFDKKSPGRPNGPSASDSFKQSCLSFDVIDSSNPGAYFLNQHYEDVNPFRHLLKELPKLVGRAPYEDLSDGMLARSARTPALRTFDVTFADFDMNTLAEVKMIHEFLNTFGTPLALTEEEGEWISLDLHCRLVRAAYEPEEIPQVDQYNFIYYLAIGPEVLSGNDDKRDAKAARALARAVRLGRPRKNAAIRRKRLMLDRLGKIEFSEYTMADRIQSLAKAIHDIMSTPKFHRFMTNEVEENILTLKRQKRKRTEARKELEAQTQELERSMRAIERQAAELESQKQALLALERDGTPGEEEQAAAGRGSVSRLQRLAQTKEARAKIAALTNEQKALAHELKLKESMCDSKREELEGVVEDDFEVQKDHNIILNRLRGGNVVNADDNLRVMVLGSDRFGRKYWFWKGFGGVIVEDRGQVGPKEQEKTADHADTKPAELCASTNAATTTSTNTATTTAVDGENDAVMEEVITKMESMADPELTSGAQEPVPPADADATSLSTALSTKDRMSINSLLIDTPGDTASEDNSVKENPSHESQSTTPEPRLSHPPVAVTLPASEPRRATERDMLDYGPIQTWSLISTNKELASLIRVLNHKGVRERVLKANLLTMRKQIESSFATVPKWAHVADVNEPRNAADGGGDLILEALRKKRGRKSKEELAEIAARMESLEAIAAAAAAAAANPTTGEVNTEGEPSGESEEAAIVTMELDHDMDEEDCPGATTEEYYDDMVRQTEGKLCALSSVLCEDSREDALSKFVSHARTIAEGEDLLKVTVGCLKLCLEALKESVEETEEMDDVEDHAADATEAVDGGEKDLKKTNQSSPPTVKKEAKEQHTSDVDSDDDEEEEEPVSTLIASPELLEKIRTHPSMVETGIPVLERPKLYWWLRARRVDEMLDAVQTYGGLHAWLEVCKRAVESMVDEGDHGDDDEEDAHRSGDEDEEGEEADEHEQDDQDDEDGDEDEQGDDDEDADEAGDDKSQEHEEEEAEEEEEPRRGRARYGKAKKQTAPTTKSPSVATTRGTRAATRSISNTAVSTTTTASGISLRSRRGPKVNYSDDASRFYHEDEEQEDEDEDEDEDETPRLRRSKRRKH
ncbi:hypothetical protein BGZ73_003229 [Actinomortierella ambigua]|nr:hypothetical protein BGZ73_003229 [Actinomortierella ambigua]